ncbi:hypothetical protein AB0K16_54475 [Nonomuraea jabiensis]|uniref:hypothetical protein n=1 Tax=Nonomuraea jabiensis TaxID=882448 RepID=UPI003436B57C
MLSAVVFDLDGTLLDTMALTVRRSPVGDAGTVRDLDGPEITAAQVVPAGSPEAAV